MTARPQIALAASRKKLRERLFIELEEDGFGVSSAANAMDLALILDRHARGERRLEAAVVVPDRGDGPLSLQELGALELAARQVPVVLLTPDVTLDARQLDALGVAACLDPTRAEARSALAEALRECRGRSG